MENTDQNQEKDFNIPDIRVVLGHVWHAKWYLVAGAVLGAFIGFSRSSKTIPIYKASSTLQIDRNTPQVLEGVREVVDIGGQSIGSMREYTETQFELIKSKEVTLRALRIMGLDTQQLYIDIKNLPKTTENTYPKNFLTLPMPLAQRAASITQAFGWTNIKKKEDLLKNLQSHNAFEILSGRINVMPVGESRLIRMSVTDKDPVLAAKIANAFSQAYVDFNLDTKIQATSSAIDWLTEQVAALKKKLYESEIALHDFKKNHNTLSVSMEDRLNLITQSYSTFSTELMQTRAKKIALESTRSRLKDALEKKIPLDAYPSIRNSPIISSLKESLFASNQEINDLALKYTEKHPLYISAKEKNAFLQKELQSEMGKVVHAIEEEYISLLDTESRLQKELELVKKEAFELNHDQINYDRMLREKENNNTLYSMVLKRQKEAKLSQMLHLNNIRIIAPAEPSYAPINKNKPASISAGLFIGALLGAVAAFIKHKLDNKITSQHHVEKILGLPFLGLVPSVSFNKKEHSNKKHTVLNPDRYILDNPRSSITENYKILRTNLSFLEAKSPLKIILITSACPKEGKSTNTCNLAISFALTGKKVLIIDADMRRPRLHKSFKIKNMVGLSNVLARTCSIEESIQHTDIPNIDLLPCGPIPPNPSELLHLATTASFLETLKKQYDHIIIDSPPLGAVADGMILASVSDGVILIIDSAKTPIQSVLRIKRNLMQSRANILGVILNNLDSKSMLNWSYYYGYYGYNNPYISDERSEENQHVA